MADVTKIRFETVQLLVGCCFILWLFTPLFSIWYKGYPYRSFSKPSLLRLHALREKCLKVADLLTDPMKRKRLRSRLRFCVFTEQSEQTVNSVARTINKGKEIIICLRHPREDDKTTLYILLHEMAHVLSHSRGHNQEFNENMNLLVHTADRHSILKQIPRRVVFCGHVVDVERH